VRAEPKAGDIKSTSESGSCPILSPFGGYGREIYHAMMRLGNYPFVGGIRPTQIISDYIYGNVRESLWKIVGDSSRY
jgi:hypothetical protein